MASISPLPHSISDLVLLTGFMESMDLELKFMEKNITVTKVCLGVVDTPLSRNAVIHEDEM